jgi:hypothetical protein
MSTEEKTKLKASGVSLDEKKLNSQEVASFFCLNWSTTRAGLEIMKDLIKNPIVKGVCAGLIGIGDIVHGIVCKD